jgi:glyoxylase-like metal-dependent hydrolase (beta-lactamase superfamily II)
MRSPIVVGLLFVSAFSVRQATAQDPRELVQRAVGAMGGERALRDLRATTVEYHLAGFSLGQSEVAASPPRASVASGRIVTDWQGRRRVRAQELRTVAGTVQRTRRVTAGGIGMLETDGRPAPDGAAAVAAVERTMRRDPERLLLSAVDNPAALRRLAAREWRGETLDGVRYALGPDTLDLYFDRWSGFLTVVETVASHPILGDGRTTTWYTRWQGAGRLVLPRQMDVTLNGMLQEHWVMSSVAVGEAHDSLFAIPDSVAARAARSDPIPPPVRVELVELAPGVWRAEGGSHHSLVVAQPTQLVVVEAPQSDVRFRAVLDTLRSRFPRKPVGLVVNTHHHWDHAGGLRSAMALGLPVATHERNAAFVRGIAAARRTVAPDELSRRPREARLTLIGDSLVLGSGQGQVVIYTVLTAHCEGLVAAWVPSARILFTSDVLSPAATIAAAGSAELVVFTASRGLSPERYAGGHGGVVAWSAVEEAARVTTP